MNKSKKPLVRIGNFLKLFKMSEFKKNIRSLGFEIPTVTIMSYFIILLIIPVIAGFLTKLHTEFIVGLVIFYAAFLPSIVYFKYRRKYQEERLTEIINYMERMIYAFQKNEKIYSALVDTMESIEDDKNRIKPLIKETIEFIDNGEAKTSNIYKEAFEIIERQYRCSRLQTLHNFLIEAEKTGCDTNRSLALILDDIHKWSIRINEYKQDRNNTFSKVAISILLGMLTTGSVTLMIPSEFSSQIAEKLSYQIGTSIPLALFLILFVYVQKQVSKSYLDYENEHEVEVEELKRKIEDYKKNKKKQVIQSVIMIIIAFIGGIMMYNMTREPIMILPIIVLALAVIFQPKVALRTKRKRLVNEIKKAYPVWLRNMIIQLQTNSVNISIQRSLEQCPSAIKKDVEELIEGIDKKPGSVEPFSNFLKEFNIDTLKASIDFMYYMAAFGGSNLDNQLNNLIEQNNHLTLSEETIRNKDAISFLGTLALAPMLISVVKLISDMWGMFDIFNMGF